MIRIYNCILQKCRLNFDWFLLGFMSAFSIWENFKLSTYINPFNSHNNPMDIYYNYPRCKNEETGAQRGSIICPSSQSVGNKAGIQTWKLVYKPHPLNLFARLMSQRV